MVLSISDRRKVICGRGQSELFWEKMSPPASQSVPCCHLSNRLAANRLYLFVRGGRFAHYCHLSNMLAANRVRKYRPSSKSVKSIKSLFVTESNQFKLHVLRFHVHFHCIMRLCGHST